MMWGRGCLYSSFIPRSAAGPSYWVACMSASSIFMHFGIIFGSMFIAHEPAATLVTVPKSPDGLPTTFARTVGSIKSPAIGMPAAVVWNDPLMSLGPGSGIGVAGPMEALVAACAMSV